MENNKRTPSSLSIWGSLSIQMSLEPGQSVNPNESGAWAVCHGQSVMQNEPGAWAVCHAKWAWSWSESPAGAVCQSKWALSLDSLSIQMSLELDWASMLKTMSGFKNFMMIPLWGNIRLLDRVVSFKRLLDRGPSPTDFKVRGIVLIVS